MFGCASGVFIRRANANRLVCLVDSKALLLVPLGLLFLSLDIIARPWLDEEKKKRERDGYQK